MCLREGALVNQSLRGVYLWHCRTSLQFSSELA
jgi:hypothetical protein